MKFFQSTIGLKITMALSGLVLIGFVIGHMLGNLQVFLGEDVLNSYATMLHGTAALIWGTRIVLLISVGIHIRSAVILTLRSKSARGKKYSQSGWLGASYATRTMRYGGVILLAFIIYHILHLTMNLTGGAVEACPGGGECVNVFKNVVVGLQNPLIAMFYIVAQIFLGLHLTHGIHSMARTLGISNPIWTGKAEKIAIITGIAITIGNCSIPLAVLLKLVS